MRSKRIARIVAVTTIDTSRAVPMAQFGTKALHVIAQASLLAIHLASIVVKAGSTR